MLYFAQEPCSHSYRICVAMWRVCWQEYDGYPTAGVPLGRTKPPKAEGFESRLNCDKRDGADERHFGLKKRSGLPVVNQMSKSSLLLVQPT